MGFSLNVVLGSENTTSDLPSVGNGEENVDCFRVTPVVFDTLCDDRL